MPVCYTGDNNVIGIFTAKDDNYGWVIPIQTILEKFGGKKDIADIAEPSPTIDTSYYMQKGIDSHDKGDYYEAIKQYDIILNDPNYVYASYNKGTALAQLGKYKEVYNVL